MTTFAAHFMTTALALALPALAGAATPGAISRIEQDLPPAQYLDGAPQQPHTLADEMRRLHVPGVSIAVIHDGKIAWTKGYGVRDSQGTPVTPATLFQAASISKSVTAVAAMSMVHDGALSLDQPANAYLQSWKLPGDDGGHVTVRQLLSHTGGVNVGGFPGYVRGTPAPTLLEVLDGAKPAVTDPIRVTTPPGTAWNYSGGGYTVLQQMMIDVDHQPFDQLMAKRVLRPMGMRHSSFTQPATPAILAQAALPFDGDGKPYPAGPWTHPELAAAGLWTTPGDLATFLIKLRTSPAAAALFTPVMNGYGLGFEIKGSGATTSFEHGGHNHGYQNTMVAYTARGDGAVVMTNGDNGDEVARALVRAVAKEYRWPGFQSVARSHVDLSPAQAAALAGKYVVKDVGDFDITYDKGELLFWLKAGQSEPLYAQSPTSFFVLSNDMSLTFDAADSGRLVMGAFDVHFDRVPSK